jgi:tripartite-type tricarboxylate transporter receptor subunit TctC
MQFPRALGYLCFAGWMGLAASPSRAQEATGTRITLVVPLAAGGAMDTIIRVLAPRLQASTGKTVIVENRTGGGTVTAAVSLAKATPDGNTLLIAPSGTLTTNVSLYKSLSYDPVKDFTPVAMYARVPFVLVANTQSGIRSIKDLVAQAKANPGKLTYASTGVGATPHLAGELLKSMTSIDLAHVPYRGSPPALNDVVGGHVQLTFADPALVQQLIEAGKVYPIGVSSLTRMAAMPEIPPLTEVGLPGFDAVSWHMVMAPAGTPKDVVAKLNTAIADFAKAPEVQKQMAGMGMIPVISPSPAELEIYLKSEIERWSKIVTQAGVAGSQ